MSPSVAVAYKNTIFVFVDWNCVIRQEKQSIRQLNAVTLSSRSAVIEDLKMGKKKAASQADQSVGHRLRPFQLAHDFLVSFTLLLDDQQSCRSPSHSLH